MNRARTDRENSSVRDDPQVHSYRFTRAIISMEAVERCVYRNSWWDWGHRDIHCWGGKDKLYHGIVSRRKGTKKLRHDASPERVLIGDGLRILPGTLEMSHVWEWCI